MNDTFEIDESMIVTDHELDHSLTPFENIAKFRERQLRRAYKLGVLHGINAQSMAQAKNDVIEFDGKCSVSESASTDADEFDDYGWEIE